MFLKFSLHVFHCFSLKENGKWEKQRFFGDGFLQKAEKITMHENGNNDDDDDDDEDNDDDDDEN